MRALLGLLLIALPALAQEPVPPPAGDPLLWPEEQRAFFQDGPGLLLTEWQRQDFLWRREGGRTEFVREFLDRDPVPETPENELRLGIERRRRLALLHYPSPLDVRWQILFLRGLPTERRQVGCRALKPLEIWKYGPDQPPLVIYRPDPPIPIRYVRPGGRKDAATELQKVEAPVPSRLWLPEDTLRVLYYAPERPKEGKEDQSSRPSFGPLAPAVISREEAEELEKLERNARATCPEFAEVERVTDREASNSQEARQRQDLVLPLQDRVWSVLRPADLAAWARAGAATSVTLPPPLATGALELDFPRVQRGLLAQIEIGRMTVRALLPVSPTGEGGRIFLSSRIEYEGGVFDDYQALYQLPSGSQGGQAVPLLLERQIPAILESPFLLRLRVRDEATGAEALVARSVVAPREPEVRHLERIRAAVVGKPLRLADWVGPDSLLLPPPPDRAVPGVWRVEPMITGSRIARVVFRVDGQVRATLDRPPFAAEVLLARGAREQVVHVEGFDENGLLVTTDQVVVPGTRPENAGAGTRPFRVDLAAPAAVGGDGGGGSGASTVLARASVSIPEGRRVETVEIRLNDAPVATLTAPPWEARVDVPAREPMVYLSAVARLDDGSQAEDVHFLRAPDNLQEVNVRLVELYATVADRSGRPVADLTEKAFEILEDGKPQTLARFERVQDLPLNLGLVIDSSESMDDSIAETQRAAAGFLGRIIRPRDRSFVIGLATRPFLFFAPTNDAGAMSKASLPDLRAQGMTSLYDSLATAVLLLREGRGQRAIVLLSDGANTIGHATLRQVLDFARRGGVTIYAIGLGVQPPRFTEMGANLEYQNPSGFKVERRVEEPRASTPLEHLAKETGGRVFYIGRAKELEKVYNQIEEDLRSRYLLAYQTELGDKGEPPPAEVRVKKRGLTVRTAGGSSR